MSLELNDYDVQEMNHMEMVEVEGGCIWFYLAAVLVAIVVSAIIEN